MDWLEQLIHQMEARVTSLEIRLEGTIVDLNQRDINLTNSFCCDSERLNHHRKEIDKLDHKDNTWLRELPG